MPFLVRLTDDAARDLEEICDYIARHDSLGSADPVMHRIEGAFSSLSEHPRRGSYRQELLEIGVREYREVFFKPYRIHPSADRRQRLYAGDRRRAAAQRGGIEPWGRMGLFKAAAASVFRPLTRR